MLNRTIFSLIAILSIATAATAEAKPKHQKLELTTPALIECDMRGCSDRVVALRAVTPAVKVAAAKPKYVRKQRPRMRIVETTITCDMYGCSDRVATARAEAPPAAAPRSNRVERAIDANGNATGEAIVIGSRPAGCPRQFCGCEASRYVFGEIRPELNLAYNWIKKFPRTQAAPGMVAARSGHVMVLISPMGGNDWLVHDGNSGGGKTRQHVMSIARYVIVDPQGSRTAAR